jgi:hypothetical protein
MQNFVSFPMIQKEFGEPGLYCVSFLRCLAKELQKHVQSTKYLAHPVRQIVFGCRQRYSIQRLPTTLFLLVLLKEYFDYPERDSNAVYITFNRGRRGESLYSLGCSKLA